jgi:hypothetical protein
MTASSGTDVTGEDDGVALAFTRLSPRGRRLALRRLANARANRARTGDDGAVDHVVASLLLTAALERNPEYARSLARPAPCNEAMDVADVVARLEAHDRGRAS